MLPKQFRLNKTKDIERILKKGKSWKEDFLRIKFLENNFNFSRFGTVVSKKLSKKTTIRNKIKRRLREIIRKKIPKIKKGIDILIFTYPGAEKESYQRIEKTLDKIFRKLNLYIT